MALDLEDQEQLDEFKVWWNQYGKMTVSLVLLALVLYASIQAYQYFQHKKSLEASDIYQTLIQLNPSEIDQVKVEAAKLMDGYATTPYAGRAAVFLAKSHFAAEGVNEAKTQLQWAIENAAESSIKAVASLQLATLLLDEKDYTGAEKVLMANVDKGYAGLKNSLLGDVYSAQGKPDQARKKYESALTQLDSEGRLRIFTQQKLDALGS